MVAHVAVLTGAGISADSGLATFRGAGGLWEGHRVEDVATPEAWAAEPLMVWRFYQLRRAGLAGNVCQLQARLEGGLPREELSAALDRAPLARWLAGVRRAWSPPFGRPHWRAARQPVAWPIAERRIAGGPGAVAELRPLEPRHSPALNAAPGAAWDVAQYDADVARSLESSRPELEVLRSSRCFTAEDMNTTANATPNTYIPGIDNILFEE